MTLIGISVIEAFWARHADARRPLLAWIAIVKNASWGKPADAIEVFGNLGKPVRLPDGRNIEVFNIKGNRYRLIASIDYRSEVVSVLRVMTHAEYSKEKWKLQI